MIDQVYCMWTLISLVFQFFLVLRKAISMFLCSNSSYVPWKKTVDLQEPTKSSTIASDKMISKGLMQENPKASSSCHQDVVFPKQEIYDIENASSMVIEKVSRKLRKRPSKIVIPESNMNLGFGEAEKERNIVEDIVEVEGNEYCLASRKGNRHVMEDGYGVITDINGDSKQAFFGVFDGHGGRASVDFVSENLGKNIIKAVAKVEEEGQLDMAIKAGYMTTDKQFLTQGVSSGTCAATVLMKNGDLHIANVGDCRIVMSRKGLANALTSDHIAGREDERTRIENSGGFVTNRNGIWRVQDSLAISRAIGDGNMKEWIISEPETDTIRLTADCEFLVMASDGLWAMVSNQEAVDIVLRHKGSIQSCKDLIDIAFSRGSRDDITVMVVDLQRFVKLCG